MAMPRRGAINKGSSPPGRGPTCVGNISRMRTAACARRIRNPSVAIVASANVPCIGGALSIAHVRAVFYADMATIKPG